jgi:hypothetical protein
VTCHQTSSFEVGTTGASEQPLQTPYVLHAASLVAQLFQKARGNVGSERNGSKKTLYAEQQGIKQVAKAPTQDELVCENVVFTRVYWKKREFSR